MPTPAAPSWQQRIRALQEISEQLCDDLVTAPLDERLAALAHLDRSFSALSHRVLAEAATDARAAGWSLRGIGHVLDRSHEQIRILTAPPASAHEQVRNTSLVP